MLRHNFAPWWPKGAVQALCRGSSLSDAWAQLSLSSHSLWVLTVKSTADLGHILHPKVAFKACRFHLESSWSSLKVNEEKTIAVFIVLI